MPVQAQLIEVVSPSTHISGLSYPIAIEAENNGVDLFYTTDLNVSADGSQHVVKIKKGRGMQLISSNATGNLDIAGSGLNLSIPVNNNPVMLHGGTLNESETWQANAIHHITSDLEIGSGDTLTIDAGCWVLLDSEVNINVEGLLLVQGSGNEPVAFGAYVANAPWGGISVGSGEANFNYCIFTEGGADQSQAFGHSGSQAVLKSNGGELNAARSFIFDCPGKGIGAQNGRIEFRNGGISRCDMGGEFGGSYVQVTGSHILDIPNDDGIFLDDDNDAFYFSGTSATNVPNLVDSCVFMIGKDDGIDHNGAILEVKNSWIEGFENEGIAASNANSVTVFNSMFKDCEQGIEAGYGSPTVSVDHCVMIDNDYGLRFGDWYDWGCSGSITCSNSIMANNTDNLHNYDLQSAGPIAGAIVVSHSMTNDAEYDANIGCLSGSPNFNSQYLLEPGSIGTGQASDGLDMGLIGSIFIGIENPSVNRTNPQSVSVYDLSGKLVLHSSGVANFERQFSTLPSGIYVIGEDHGTTVFWRKQGLIH